MTIHDPKDGALPVSGYKPQTQAKVDLVNSFKAAEERILRMLDALRELPNADDPDAAPQIDQRWLAIGRTQIEQGFMAVNRSIFQPGRVERLPEDDEPDAVVS